MLNALMFIVFGRILYTYVGDEVLHDTYQLSLKNRSREMNKHQLSENMIVTT